MSSKHASATISATGKTRERLLSEIQELRAQLANLKETEAISKSEREAWLEKLQFISDAMESTSQPFGAGSPDGATLIFNEAFCRLTGYTRVELYHINWATGLTTPESRIDELKALEVLDRTYEPQWYEKRYRRKDGSIIPVELLTHVACDLKGDILYYYSFITDISVRKRKEDELRKAHDMLENAVEERSAELGKSEERLQMMIEASPVPIVVFEESRNYFVNKKFVEAFGYTIEDIPSVNEWWPLAYPDEEYREFVKKRWYAAIDKAVKNRTTIEPQEAIVTCKDGTKKQILCYFSSIGDLNLSVFYDLTERKQAEESLRESEERYRGLFESSIDGIIITDLAGNILKVNPAFQRMLGYSEEELRHLSYQQLTPASWHDMEERIVREQIIHRSYSDEYEKEYIRKDGSVFPINIRVWLIKDKLGQSQGMWGIVRDITRRKRIEDELGRVQAQAELYLDLMGHDINNMNQVGMSYLEVALETLKEDGMIGKKDVELLEKPLHAIQDSTRLIDNVRKLRSAKSKEYPLQPIDLKIVIVDVIEHYSKVTGRHVTINYTPAESRVLATGLVKDVFINIVGNAVKHSDPDKPLEISIAQIRVYGTDVSYHKVIIDDNGPGIPDKLKTRIFNRFERGNTNAKGKGLGLYLVKTLVHDFNGEIWVEDRVPGDHTKGARFVVILPAV